MVGVTAEIPVVLKVTNRGPAQDKKVRFNCIFKITVSCWWKPEAIQSHKRIVDRKYYRKNCFTIVPIGNFFQVEKGRW